MAGGRERERSVVRESEIEALARALLSLPGDDEAAAAAEGEIYEMAGDDGSVFLFWRARLFHTARS